MTPATLHIPQANCGPESDNSRRLADTNQPPRLSDHLTDLRRRSDGLSLTVEDMEKALKERGFAVILLLLALPCFLVPGLSIPFGLAVFIIGLRMAAGLKPWLPAFIRQMRLSPARLEKVLGGGIRFVHMLEKVVKPRMHFLHRWPGMMTLIGLGIASGGLLLLLPLPIPFSNAIPASAVLLLTAGMMERDGLLVLIGHVTTLASWAFIALCWLIGTQGIERFLNAFQESFP